MLTPNEKIENIQTKLSKLFKVMQYYLKETYKNLNFDLTPRIVPVDIYLQLVKEADNRPEYRVFIQPVSALPDIKIKNPASFLAFCNIHNFFPAVNNLYIKTGANTISLQEYKEFTFLIRLFNLFFFKGYDYVSYDIIRHYLKQDYIRKIFEENDIVLPSQAELLYLLKLLEDIKKSSFDIPQNILNKKLSKLKNTGTYRENIFLEVYMKYENIVRERMSFENTYLKSASYDDDMKNKTDFYLLYLPNGNKKFKKTKLSSISVQFTVADDYGKLSKVEKFFLNKADLKDFLYIQVDGDFRKNILDLENKYENWIENSNLRQLQSPDNFPFFINTLDFKNLQAPIIIYFAMHGILKNSKEAVLNLGKVDNIDFTKLDIRETYENLNHKTAKRQTWKLFYEGEYIGMVVKWWKKG